MKRLITASYSWKPEFEGTWSDEEKELWGSIDWKQRNYEDYIIDDDIIRGEVRFYGIRGPNTMEVDMVKHIRSNPIYPPYYEARETPMLQSIIDRNNLVGPMYDGDTFNGYDIHNRYETYELYDMLSR